MGGSFRLTLSKCRRRTATKPTGGVYKFTRAQFPPNFFLNKWDAAEIVKVGQRKNIGPLCEPRVVNLSSFLVQQKKMKNIGHMWEENETKLWQLSTWVSQRLELLLFPVINLMVALFLLPIARLFRIGRHSLKSHSRWWKWRHPSTSYSCPSLLFFVCCF